MGTITLRAFGSFEDLEEFKKALEKLYGNILASPPIKNTRGDPGYRFYATVNIKTLSDVIDEFLRHVK